jgi:hypothetical protein
MKFTFCVHPDRLISAVQVAKAFLKRGEVRSKQRDCVIYAPDDQSLPALAVWGDANHVRVYAGAAA